MFSCEDKISYEGTACSEKSPIKAHMKNNRTVEDLLEDAACLSSMYGETTTLRANMTVVEVPSLHR